MSARRLFVPPPLRDRVEAFLKAHPSNLRPVDGKPWDLRIAVSRGRRPSRIDTIESGGWIACATAWAMARKHGIPLRRLGALCDLLDVRIRACGLGCFE